MTFTTAKNLLAIDVKTLPLEKLQIHKVRLIDAWRESRGDYGMFQAVRNGFYKTVQDVGATGFCPVDKWLTQNLQLRLEEAEKQENYLLSLPPLRR